MQQMTVEEVLARLMDLKVRDPVEYQVVVELIRRADVVGVPRTPVTPAKPEVRITEK